MPGVNPSAPGPENGAVLRHVELGAGADEGTAGAAAAFRDGPGRVGREYHHLAVALAEEQGQGLEF